MKSIELNRTGNFDPWQPHLLEELRKKDITETLGQKLLFENEMVKIWDVSLLPGERLPFRKINCNCSFVAMTDGMVISRSGTGTIFLLHLEHGDSQFMPLTNSESIYDLENIGDSLIVLYLSEFKPTIMKTGVLLDLEF